MISIGHVLEVCSLLPYIIIASTVEAISSETCCEVLTKKG